MQITAYILMGIIYLFAFFCFFMGIYSNIMKKPSFFITTKARMQSFQVTNIKLFNMGVSILWLIYAVFMMIIGLIAYYWRIKFAFILFVFFIVAISPVLSYCYILLENKYRISSVSKEEKK